MNKTDNEAEIGLLSDGVAEFAECNPGMMKRIRNFFNRICKRDRKIQVNSLNINLNVVVDKKEVDQLIMEYNNNFNHEER